MGSPALFWTPQEQRLCPPYLSSCVDLGQLTDPLLSVFTCQVVVKIHRLQISDVTSFTRTRMCTCTRVCMCVCVHSHVHVWFYTILSRRQIFFKHHCSQSTEQFYHCKDLLQLYPPRLTLATTHVFTISVMLLFWERCTNGIIIACRLWGLTFFTQHKALKIC